MRVPTTTRTGPVRTQPARRCPRPVQPRSSHRRWTRCRGLHTHVADAANLIERAMPGRVVGVNTQARMSNGLSREIDVDLGDLIVQVKSGNARGLTGQLQATTSSTGRTVIGYAPGIPDAAWLNAARQG